MYVIIKHIPRAMIIDDLEALVLPVLKSGFLRKQGHLKAIKLIQRVDKNNKPIESHALIRVCSTSVQKRLIKSINNSPFKQLMVHIDDSDNGQNLSASEFFVRSYGNDRRSALCLATEKRKQDRRRLDLVMRPLSEKLYDMPISDSFSLRTAFPYCVNYTNDK